MASFVTHLESAIDGSSHDHRIVQNLHAGRPLWVRYDLPAIAAEISRDEIAARDGGLWSWRELLPVESPEHEVSLGEGLTPLVPCRRLGAELGLPQLYIKDESRLPTGSFKARGLSLAVSRAKELGVTRVAIPTAGNAGGALAAYAARAGLEAWVFMPADTPSVNRTEAQLFGAHVVLVDGLIGDCGARIREGADKMGWFDCSTLKEPYRLEGKKTMGLELARQLDWTLPDVILYPTGGGTGLVAMWKAFEELEALGWIEPGQRPRMIACQSDGCAPIVRAFEAGARHAEPFANAATCASGVRVPAAVGDFMILDAVRSSGGLARSAPEGALMGRMRQVSALEGVALCPEAATCVEVLAQLVAEGLVRAEERIVIFNTGAAQKYAELLERVVGPAQGPG